MSFPVTQAQPADHGLPVEFEPNRGQAAPEIRYIARTSNGEAHLTQDGLRIVQSTAHARHAWELHFAGAKPKQIREESAAGGIVNYYHGQDPAAWIGQIPLYRQIRYTNLYPLTDLVFHGNASRLEYDFELRPGANPERLQIDLSRNEKAEPQQDGSLLVTTGGHALRLLAPSAFQNNGGEKHPVEVKYRMISTSKIGFELDNYDHARPLLIDPVVAYAQELNAGNDTEISAIAADTNGNLIMTGRTFASDYPVVNGKAGSNSGAAQVFVTKVDPTGENILYSTYLPASGFSGASGIAVDSTGNAYIIGSTGGADFPVTSQNLGTCSSDTCNTGFITKLDSSGSMVYSTLLSSAGVSPSAIAVNANGNAFISGTVGANLLKTVNAFQPAYEGQICVDCSNAFYAELNPQGTDYVFSSYLGSEDSASGIALDKNGNVYVAGLCNIPYASTIPLKGEFQSVFGGFFLTKFAADGKTLLFGSVLGGDVRGVDIGYETLSGVAVGPDGTVYLAGNTRSDGFPFTITAHRHPIGTAQNAQMFAMALNPSLTSLVYSTYLGDGFAKAMAVDSKGNLYAAGSTAIDPIQFNNAVVSDVPTGGTFLELDKTGNPIQTSAFGGHTTTQIPAAMTADANGDVYLAGNPASNIGLALTDGWEDPILVGGNSTQIYQQDNVTTFFAKIAPEAKPQISLGSQLPFLPLHNVGSADLHISNISFNGGLAKAWGNCGSTVPAGTTCMLTLTDANGKLAQGFVTITSDASPSVQTFTPYLDSHSVGSPVGDHAWFDLSQLYFPPQQTGTSSSPHPFRIWNLGAANLTLQSIAAYGSLVQTNNCGQSLTPGSYCTVQVVWTATDNAAGNTLSIAYDNLPRADFNVPSGFLSSSTPLLLSQTNPIPFGTQTVGHPSLYRTITVTNVSNSQASAPGVALNGDSEFTLAGNTCTASLASQQSCIVAVLFTPVIDGDRSATLQFSGGASAAIQVYGTGQIDSAVTVSPLQLGWPLAVFPTGYSLDVKLTNSSSTVVPISGFTFSRPDYSETDNCTGSVPAAGSCTVHVLFQPQDLGNRYGSMTINFGGKTTAQTITLLGNGVYPIELSPTSLDFGKNNLAGKASPAQNVAIGNPYSSKPLNYTLSIDGPFTFNNQCANPMPGNLGCVMSVTFNPTTAGPQTGSLTVAIPGLSKASSIPLTGTAYTPSAISAPSTLAFGGVANGTSNTLPLSVSDTGSQNLTISGLAISGTNAGDFSVASGQCATIVGSGSCNVNVSFRPTATETRSAVLTITGNAANSPQTVALTGTGQAPGVSLSPSSLDFGSQNQGSSSAPLQVTLTNSGNGGLTLTNIMSSSDFSQTNNCGTTLAAGASCQIALVFTPSTVGAESGTLTIADNAGSSPQTVSLTGTGTAPSVSIGPGQGGSLTTTVSSGQPATYNLTLTGSAGFSGTVTLTCSGAPQNASCSVTPPALMLSPGASQAFSVKVTTQSSTSAQLDLGDHIFVAGAGLASLLAGLLLFRRKRFRLLLVMFCAAALLGSLATTGCGGGGSSDTKPPASSPASTPAGTYKLTVTATAGTVSTSQILTLIVK